MASVEINKAAPVFPQKVTFIGTLTIDTEGMDWASAAVEIDRALLNGVTNTPSYSLDLVKVTRMEIVEED